LESNGREIRELLANLPGRLSPETLLTEVHFKLELIERLERHDRGETEMVSHEDVKQRFDGWQP
jgi:hypothetical protein